ncbi:MAG: hypothetical protein A2268_01390 [Candidatus Raymondbacteria bacterium RifOxyA12_full_50_37]|uniref:DUF362 domain-containing protein n=1 Tax=Candidatus Raymondbacteria bacterium RIFOXYD12_FULL_49_13 TaxID=1817890 RepID=A0A1F7FJW2_UNCRA|nr:MAG: hypothetical protein A2268_01390 [Candidatus Raymondbacteria bacterium RifOxyA12_full_50_37]OGJ87956.1 MAG: hypothetical protein A2248_01945 [Candidatus Raymondbacteria bacterium RIFOXYA2_FULL_49_16]OGJ88013.1 MAG: hypothetical protein A2350_00940 [Candidatus Raymondbacteria bacterium RifOxyB12_full_50_8]OGJ95617.1 MAG: hypothetical protein A2453_13085 [Candidatus Raymondbacteria bacterium RIFOXYC2_FULL_50_21]OGJ97635.1 MAG: hypothetical protein A2487_12955 [Candidatus Raymondbacteria b
MKCPGKISRRSFLKTGASATAASTLVPAIVGLSSKEVPASPSPLNIWPGRVVLNYENRINPHPTCNQTGGTLSDETTMMAMIDNSIRLLTGIQDVGEAWKAIFPATLSVTSRIAIKINILTDTTIPPHPFLVKGIVEGLKLMSLPGGNFPANRIYIYDGNASADWANKGFTSTNFPDVNLVPSDSQTTRTGDDAGARNRPYSNTLYNCDFLINIPTLRGHSTYAESYTMGFKSHYGTYPTDFHSTGDPFADPSSCPAYLRDINCVGPVYNKTVLTAFCSIYGHYGSSPSASANSFLIYAQTKDPATADTRPNTVIMSTDPVTAEFHGVKVRKLQFNQTYNVSDMPNYLRASAGKTSSLSASPYNIGIIDEADMDYREIINGVITNSGSEKFSSSASKEKAAMQVNPNPVSPNAYIDFLAPQNSHQKQAVVEISDIKGQIIWRKEVSILGINNRVVWTGVNSRGKRAVPGRYVVSVNLGTKILSNTITLI